MTDAGPRIFRTLEKTDGRDSFDAIVRAAVATFATVNRPSEGQSRDFARLVLPLFDRTGRDTRQALASALASVATLPRDLVARLLAEPTVVVAPFFLASPLLTPDDLATLGKRRDAATKKLLKARKAPESVGEPPPKRKRGRTTMPKPAGSDETAAAPPLPDAEREPRPSPARQTALLSTGTPDRGSSAEPLETPAGPMPITAEEARAVLRQLATGGRRSSPPNPALPEPDLLSLALARDAAGFHAMLSAKLLLDPVRIAAIEADDMGRELATALKALDTGKVDAMTMLMMLKPAVGSDVAAFEGLERIYETLDIAACRMRFPIGPGAFAEPAPHRPIYTETRAPIRPEPRSAVFGRRASIPSDANRKTRRS